MKPIYLIVSMLLIWGCEPIEEGLPTVEQKLVIDGAIEQGQFPVVYLTLSSGFYDPVDSMNLLDLIVTTARVSVSDGENEEVLTLFRNEGYFPPYYYRGTALRGVIGKEYTLEVRSRGETYTATTTIPAPVALDSLWFLQDGPSDSLVNIWVRFKDDGSAVNRYRSFTRIISKNDRYIPAYQSTLSDRAFNGESFRYPILKQPADFTKVAQDVYFTKGDTVNVKFCTLDQVHFDFWRTLERELYSAGNPFGSSGNEVESNIRGTKPALGVWGGYGASYHRIVLK